MSSATMGQPHVINPKLGQRLAFGLLWLSAGAVVLPIAGLVVYMMVRGLEGLNWELVSSTQAGLLPAIVGTTALVTLTTLVAAPLGIGAAIYLSEYARQGVLVRLIKLAIVNLAGVPSVVYGLFGLAAFVVLLGFGRCLAAGACTLALLVLPLVISASEEALRQIPRGLREGSLALGATKWQTIRRIVLPNALPGIITGLILSVGRAAGETAPILFTAAFYSLTNPFPTSVFDEILALPYQLYVMATEAPDVEDATKWATAVVLVTLVLSMNLLATVMRARLRRRSRW